MLSKDILAEAIDLALKINFEPRLLEGQIKTSNTREKRGDLKSFHRFLTYPDFAQ